jgi:putative FmdB family regulatory protein
VTFFDVSERCAAASVARQALEPRATIERGMPIYEYECADCRRRVSLLIRSAAAAAAPACPRCGGVALTRVMSRFVTVKSEDARLESLADTASLGDLDENDPASVARLMKKMGQEFGDDLGDDFESAVDEAMAESDSPGGEGDGTSATPESADTAGASDL